MKRPKPTLGTWELTDSASGIFAERDVDHYSLRSYKRAQVKGTRLFSPFGASFDATCNNRSGRLNTRCHGSVIALFVIRNADNRMHQALLQTRQLPA